MQARHCPFVGGFKQIENLVVVDLIIGEGNLDPRPARRIFVDLSAPSIDPREQSWDDPTLGQCFPTSHRMRFPRSRGAVGENGDVESVEEMLDRGRHCKRIRFPVSSFGGGERFRRTD